MSKVTEQEAREAGLPIELMQQWQDLMQELWTDCIKQFRAGHIPVPKQGSNEILIGSKYVIKVNIVNSKFLEAHLDMGDMELAGIRYMGYGMPICIAFFSIITCLENG